MLPISLLYLCGFLRPVVGFVLPLLTKIGEIGIFQNAQRNLRRLDLIPIFSTQVTRNGTLQAPCKTIVPTHVSVGGGKYYPLSTLFTQEKHRKILLVFANTLFLIPGE